MENKISDSTLKQCWENICNYENGNSKNDDLYNLSIRIWREVGSNDKQEEEKILSSED